MVLTEDHNALHEDDTRQETVDNDVPHTLRWIFSQYATTMSSALLTPPLSVFDTKTNINRYLYTHELTQKTTAQATATRGASGAKKNPTAAMNSRLELKYKVRHFPCVALTPVLTSRSHTGSRAAASTRGSHEVSDRASWEEDSTSVCNAG